MSGFERIVGVSKMSFGLWHCICARPMCVLHRDGAVCTHVYMCVCAGPRAECQFVSRVSIMALAHDAESLNAIAANSAAASLASLREKLGRNDVEVSCVCPLACPCVLATVFGLFVSV